MLLLNWRSGRRCHCVDWGRNVNMLLPMLRSTQDLSPKSSGNPILIAEYRAHNRRIASDGRRARRRLRCKVPLNLTLEADFAAMCQSGHQIVALRGTGKNSSSRPDQDLKSPLFLAILTIRYRYQIQKQLCKSFSLMSADCKPET